MLPSEYSWYIQEHVCRTAGESWFGSIAAVRWGVSCLAIANAHGSLYEIKMLPAALHLPLKEISSKLT